MEGVLDEPVTLGHLMAALLFITSAAMGRRNAVIAWCSVCLFYIFLLLHHFGVLS